MRISVENGGTAIFNAVSEGDHACLVFDRTYREGDAIIMEFGGEGHFVIELDPVLGRSLIYTKGGLFRFPIPFGARRDCYNELAFLGKRHMIHVRKAMDFELSYRNLALNPYDCHTSDTVFPHSKANIETRGESVFASRNAFDGYLASCGHGKWPYSSWGINRDPDAELRLDFGRKVVIDRIRIYIRTDFPHDSWWRQVEIVFSDGCSNVRKTLDLGKVEGPQEFMMEPVTAESLTLGRLLKTTTDDSPFPALTQLEVYGTEGQV